MKRCWMFALCLLAWAPEAQAIPPLPTCVWEFPALDAPPLQVVSGAPIILEGSLRDAPCARQSMDAPWGQLTTSEVALEVSTDVDYDAERVVIAPASPLAEGSYVLELSYNRHAEDVGWEYVTREVPVEVSFSPVRVDALRFEPEVIAELDEVCCDNVDVCGDVCTARSRSSLIVANLSYLTQLPLPLEVRAQFADVEDIEQSARLVPDPESLPLVVRLPEESPQIERDLPVNLDAYASPCVRLVLRDIDAPGRLLHVSPWVCAGSLAGSVDCGPPVLDCEAAEEDLREMRRGEQEGMQPPPKGPSTVTARPSGGCGGCATAPGAPMAPTLLMLALLVLGVRRREERR